MSTNAYYILRDKGIEHEIGVREKEKMAVIDNAIEAQYRKLSERINNEYEVLYDTVPNEKLKAIFSTLHANLVYLFGKMNFRLPTQDDGDYYWAGESRGLLETIEIVAQLYQALSGSPLEFQIVTYYKNLFDICSEFLCQYRGSTIPPHMEKVELYYTIPIFIFNNKGIIIEAPKIKTIDQNYIKSIAERAQEDINNSNFDSTITKCRTLVEEIFCYVIELKEEKPSESGDISDLYKQVKGLYNMHQSKEADVRINMLLSGFEKILTAIAQMRNKNSDSHGIGSKRFNIEEHHARLFLNAAIAMSDFVLAVAEKSKTKSEVEHEA